MSNVVFDGLYILSALFESLTLQTIVFQYTVEPLHGHEKHLDYSNCIGITILAHIPAAICIVCVGRCIDIFVSGCFLLPTISPGGERFCWVC